MSAKRYTEEVKIEATQQVTERKQLFGEGMAQESERYAQSLRRYAEQWTDTQIREAIVDEHRILRDQSLSEVARDNSKLICNIYSEARNIRYPLCLPAVLMHDDRYNIVQTEDRYQ